jgi:glycine betaine/choline ABC-type transport system substrate-binding protein
MNRRRFLYATAAAATYSGCTTTPKLILGSKDSIENRLLGEIVSQLLEAKLKARLDRRFGITGSTVLYQSLQGGDMDIYPEYTRVAFKVLLHHEEVADRDLMLQAMRKDLATYAQASCTGFLGFDSSYALVALADNLNFSSVTKLSELGANGAAYRLGCTSDFAQSPEGYNELKLRYKLPEAGATRIEPINQLFFALRDHRVDLVVTTITDPRLTDKRYKVLQDDLGALGPNLVSLVYRKEPMVKYPEVEPLLESLAGRIDNPAMQALNAEVEINKRGFTEVAAEWLKQSKLV